MDRINLNMFPRSEIKEFTHPFKLKYEILVSMIHKFEKKLKSVDEYFMDILPADIIHYTSDYFTHVFSDDLRVSQRSNEYQ